MKITLVLASLALFSSSVFGQNLPVSQLPETKKAVIEEFTAFRCGNCPLGHQMTNTIGDNLGEENVLVIAYHVGGLATPQSAGDPDFRTPDGDQMRNHFNVAGTPSGPVNRSSFRTSNFIVNANNWSSNCTSEVANTADANVALDVAIDHNTREVTINTEVFYTTNSANTHYLTVGYLEEGIIASQISYNSTWNSDYFYPNGDYYHRHVFRGFINSAEGDVIDANATAIISNDYTFTVPTDINGQPVNIYSLEFFAIVHEGLNGSADSEIINAAKSTDSFVNITEFEKRELIVAPNPNNGSFVINGLEDSDVVMINDLSGRAVDFIREGNRVEVATSGFYLLNVAGDKGSGTLAFTAK
ncbi:Omp28-related outer membrane protein [Crocinitomicaceae bacterium]|nr:Omp28-related outer membrane protein [Crocinitomicaceae bacterium]